MHLFAQLRLQVEGDGRLSGDLQVEQSILFGTSSTGAGTKLLWIPAKGAFRAGRLQEDLSLSGLEENNWDLDSIGINSFAAGFNSKASGDYSVVGGGNSNTASGSRSFVGSGSFNTASGLRSFVGGGDFHTASGSFSFVGGGNSNKALGSISVVGGGYFNTASGSISVVVGGDSNIASGHYSLVGGGRYLQAKSFGEAVFGLYNEDYTPNNPSNFDPADRLFVIGNGTGSTNRSNAVTVLKNGNVGIGLSVPTSLLHLDFTGPNGITLEGDNTGDARLRIWNVGGGNHFIFDDISESNALSFESSGAIRLNTSGANERVRIEPNGRVGIGKIPTTTVGLLLDVNGDVYANGSIITSDRRFKKNINNLVDPLTRLTKVRGVSYQFRSRRFKNRNFSKDTQFGLIAQELELIFPEVVRTGPDGYKAINYDGLIPVLIESVKAQQEEIETVKLNNEQLVENNHRLKKEHELIHARLDDLEQLVQQLLAPNQVPEAIDPQVIELRRDALLYQNRPNPFGKETTITYYIPEGIGNAQLRISAPDGKVLRKVDISGRGPGQTVLTVAGLPAGTYAYSLLLDGQLWQTRQMVIDRN